MADSGAPREEVLAHLDQWRRELDAIYSGRANHPYARRLEHAVHRYGLTRDQFDILLGALERDVDRTHVDTYDELRDYCESVASSLAQLCLQILGVAGEPTAASYARDVGVALQLANILRDVDADATAGRIYLPRDELADAGVAELDIMKGNASPGLASVCRRQAARARTLIARARRQLSPRLFGALLVPEIWADVYLALLEELEAVDFDVFGDPPYLRRRRKLGIALRRWAMSGRGGPGSRLRASGFRHG